MENFFVSVYYFLVGLYDSQAFTLLKFLLGVYLFVIIVDIILLVIARGIGANVRFLLYGAHIPAALTSGKKQTRKKWNALRRMLESEREGDWKVMIIKADGMIFQLIQKLGHKGNTMGEVLMEISDDHIGGIDKVKEAHEICNQIVLEEEFVLEKEKARETMDKYETFLEFFDV